MAEWVLFKKRTVFIEWKPGLRKFVEGDGGIVLST